MADVFISYSSADREAARVLAERLGERGLAVWWDRSIPPGRVYDEVIQEALHAAGCVVVLWSDDSVKSNWVRTEAAEGLAQDKLVPALIEPVTPPIEFKRIQAADLSGWTGDADHTEYRKLAASVDELLRRPSTAAPGARPAGPPRPAATPASARGPWLLLTAAALLAGVIAWAGVRWIAGHGGDAASAPAARSPAAAAASPTPPEAPNTREGVAPSTRQADAVAALPSLARTTPPGRVNLLAPANGGELVTAAHERWSALIDGDERSYAYVDKGEGVFAFKDGRRASFDTFAVLVPDTADTNLRDFELLVADELGGPFQSIGSFATQNLRIMKNPYQEFRFVPTKAKYLKLRSLKNHVGSNGAVAAYEIQLFGTLE
jgi:TIR domain